MKYMARVILIISTGFILFWTMYINPASASNGIDNIGPKTEQVKNERYGHIYYVSVRSGSDKKGDGSAVKPWQTLVFALRQIGDVSVSSPCAIFTAAGKYDQGTVHMRAFIDIYGGFEDRSWERDIDEYKTELDGQGVRRVVIGADKSKIDGFTIQHGLGEGHGGAILCDDTSPEISNNYILDNLAAGPMHFNRNRIHQEGHHGGAIACLYNAVPVIRNNYFQGNKTAIGNGGAVAFYGWLRLPDAPEPVLENNRMTGGLQALLENNIFIHNIAGMDDLSRTRSSNGGAVSCAFEARPVIRNNLLIGNQARGRGDAGGIYVEYFSYPLIEGNRIVGNIGDDDGGGIYVMKLSHPVIRENLITGNWTLGGGVGGIRISKEGRATISANKIFANPGGGIQCVDSYVEIENNLIFNNSGAYGIYFSSNFDYMKPSFIRENTIRENRKGDFIVAKNTAQAPLFAKNNVDDQSIEEGPGNFNTDPAFVDDGFNGEFVGMIHDRQGMSYQVEIKEPLPDEPDLQGRIIKIGDHWGVIRTSRGHRLVVWGDFEILPPTISRFEIVPSYSVK